LYASREEGAKAPGERRAARLVRLGAGAPDLPVRIERSRWFSSAAQLAERYSSGHFFLAGDAAHRVTPRGGMGLISVRTVDNHLQNVYRKLGVTRRQDLARVLSGSDP
jgi:2-polyprenyl-6-methoxyphenol hydroxylase-like FAD-dependent oxidoreductase